MKWAENPNFIVHDEWLFSSILKSSVVWTDRTFINDESINPDPYYLILWKKGMRTNSPEEATMESHFQRIFEAAKRGALFVRKVGQSSGKVMSYIDREFLLWDEKTNQRMKTKK